MLSLISSWFTFLTVKSSPPGCLTISSLVIIFSFALFFYSCNWFTFINTELYFSLLYSNFFGDYKAKEKYKYIFICMGG